MGIYTKSRSTTQSIHNNFELFLIRAIGERRNMQSVVKWCYLIMFTFWGILDINVLVHRVGNDRR